MPRRIQSHWIEGPAGKLEALLEEPEDRAPLRIALVCHPHPLHGGTMHNKVVYRIARGLRRSGAVVLRFNFRGVGRSEGQHAAGIGEIEDARAVVAWLRERYPNLPVWMAGFSFGSRVVLKLGCQAAEPDRPERVIAAGFPTQHGSSDFLDSCGLPKVFIQSTHDEYGPRQELEALYQRFSEPKRLVWINARNHFFEGGLEELEEAVAGLGA